MPLQPAALELLTGSGLKDEFLDRARVIDIDGTAVPILDVGDLIVAKVLRRAPGP